VTADGGVVVGVEEEPVFYTLAIGKMETYGAAQTRATDAAGALKRA
jgi:hypothetical protein